MRGVFPRLQFDIKAVKTTGEIAGEKVRLRDVHSRTGLSAGLKGEANIGEAVALGERLAAELRVKNQKMESDRQKM